MTTRQKLAALRLLFRVAVAVTLLDWLDMVIPRRVKSPEWGRAMMALATELQRINRDA